MSMYSPLEQETLRPTRRRRNNSISCVLEKEEEVAVLQVDFSPNFN